MLKNLQIQNYALIDKLDIEFSSNLNIITGETGAGKSILLGALGLILGQRADANVLKDKSKGCVVEGLFDISGYSLNAFFEENDIDYYDNTIIRRQINEAGKSRAFINETPVNLNVLKDLSERLIDIHSQHENLLLGSGQFQLKVLDSFAALNDEVLGYLEIYKLYNELKSELERLKAEAENKGKDFDYLQFQLSELTQAKLQPNELPELELLQQQLLHATEIKQTLQTVSVLLSDEANSTAILLKEAEQSLKRIVSFFPESIDYEKRIESCRIELKDLAHEIELRCERVEVDPNQLEQITVRLDMLYGLLQKHKLSSIDELIQLRAELEAKVDLIGNFDFNIGAKQKQLNELEARLDNAAKSLSQRRKAVVGTIESSIIELLQQLGIKHAAFKAHISKTETYTSTGMDRVTFQFSANKQIPLQELSKVASGGELSRLMLSLKSLMVKSSGLPTIIFDEIDTGVSGDIADKVGNIIQGMAEGMQVINITHLPQIASKGNTHFLVYKDNQSAQSSTQIKLLDKNERIVEIAKMLSGEKISDAAIVNAKELLALNGN